MSRKISDAEVYALRVRRVINREYLDVLAAEYKISVSEASRIVRGYSRMAAGGPLQEGKMKLPKRTDNFTAEEDNEIIKRMVAAGGEPQAVADAMGVTVEHVTRITDV